MNNLNVKKERNSSVEVLRIVAMIMIVVSHYTVHGGVDKMQLMSTHPINTFLLQITCLGNLGVDIFICITGYFMVTQVLHTEKLIKLIAQVWTYSVGIYTLLVLTGHEILSIKSIIKVFFPTSFCQYWFFTDYIVLFVLSPFINKALASFGRELHLKIIILMLTIWSIAPTFTTCSFYGSGLPQFVMLYTIGAYARLYPDCWINDKRRASITAIVSASLMLLSTISMDVVGTKYSVFSEHATWFYSRTSIFVIALAFSLLIVAINKQSWHSRIVNEISACTFGIYLIHDNNYVRGVIWSKIFKTTVWANSTWMPVHMILTVTVVFVICAIVEFVRRKLIEAHYLNGIKHLSIFIDNKIQCIIEKKI